MRWWIAISGCGPLLWFLALNVQHVAARWSLGAWPDPSHQTRGVATWHRWVVQSLQWSFWPTVISFFLLAPMLMLIHAGNVSRIERKGQFVANELLLCVPGWFAGFILALAVMFVDPIDAWYWMLD